MTTRGRPPKVDTNERKVGQDTSYTLPASGPVDREEFSDQFEIVEEALPKDKLNDMAFFEEPVEVLIFESTNPNVDPIVRLCNGGSNQFVVRGHPTWIRRKYLEVLARAKSESITTEECLDMNGNKTTRIRKHQGAAFGFTVQKDPNPNGTDWLRGILSQGA